MHKLDTVIIETKEMLDLVKFTHFYHERLAIIKPNICYFRFGESCYYWIWFKSKKLTYLFSIGKCPPNESEWISFSPLRGDTFSFKRHISVKRNLIELFECRSKILIDYLKNTSSFILLDVSRLPGFRANGVIEIIRLASYYRLPIFLYHKKDLYSMVIVGLIPELSLPGLDKLAYFIYTKRDVSSYNMENQGYALYIEGVKGINEAYRLSNKVNVLDVYAPIIKVKKILGKIA